MECLRSLNWYKSLADKKARKTENLFLAEGERTIKQIALLNPSAIKEMLTIPGKAAEWADYPIRLLDEKQFKKISSSKTPQGIAAVISMPQEVYDDVLPENPGKKILYLEDIQDPGNMGTLIRTAAAFNFDGICMTRGCADLFSPKTVQASAGSLFALWLRRTSRANDLLAQMKKNEYKLIAATASGSKLEPNDILENRIILALGNEGSGLSKPVLNLADVHAAVPINKKNAESLNVSVAGGILMYQLF